MRARFLGVFAVFSSMVLAACRGSEPPIAADREVPPSAPAPRPERPEREHYLGMAVPEHEPVPFPNVRGECELGHSVSCGAQMPRTSAGAFHELRMHCRLDSQGVPRLDRSDCATPLVVAFDDAPVAFEKPAGSFTVGPFARTEWVSSRTPWLALDADGSGCVEDQAELFRFDRLAALDDDGDGRIDEHDAAYARLALWADRDRDRRCTSGEMTSLSEAGIVALEVTYVTKPDHAFGSHEGETASLWFRAPGGALRRGRLIDVYLAPLP